MSKRDLDESEPDENNQNNKILCVEQERSQVCIVNIAENSSSIVDNLDYVIHLRNLCPNITEKEIVQLAFPFGKVKKLILLKAKNQAFIEFFDPGAVTKILDFFSHSTNETSLRGYKIYAQNSTHKHLDTSHVPPAAASLAESIINTLNSLYDANSTQETPTNILRIKFDGYIPILNLNIIHQIFSKYGEVQKIITFTKNYSFQAFVQYMSSALAQMARLNLCGLNINEVKYNNDKMRDYTLHPMKDQANGVNSSKNFLHPKNGEGEQSLRFHATMDNPMLQYSNMLNQPYTIISPFPGNMGHLIPSNLALQNVFGQPLNPNSNKPMIINLDALNQSPIVFKSDHIGSVIIVSNLNDQKVTADALFILFGVYGDVYKIKILYNKRDTALIQMSNPSQAHLAINNLDNLRMYGKNIRVSISKYQSIKMPKESQEDGSLTKEYINSPLHRFKKPGSKNYNNIVPPSSVLHLSNIPLDMEENFVRNLFDNSGFNVKGFKYFVNEKRMALIQLDDIEEAISALIALHNHPINNTHNLRISFSKSHI
ncbi:unnamed protein product [Gordionus sp. m RMFG-2023]